MARVRRRMVRANTLRVSASALVVATMVGGGLLGVQALAAVGPPGPGGGPAAGATTGECPAELTLADFGVGSPPTLFPKAPTLPLASVTVCRYRNPPFRGVVTRPQLAAGPVHGDPARFGEPVLTFATKYLGAGGPVPSPAPQGSPGAWPPGSPPPSPPGSVAPASGTSPKPWPSYGPTPVGSPSPWPSAPPDDYGSPVPPPPSFPGCGIGNWDQKIVTNLVDIVDANGTPYRYFAYERLPHTCPAAPAVMPAEAPLFAAIDHLLGSP
ncbi:MAG: hypothetical protein J2P15_14640 [Micromonosporaceae bacterium]|nr:hypothetical protein [Micromonosporaceae bacterium]